MRKIRVELIHDGVNHDALTVLGANMSQHAFAMMNKKADAIDVSNKADWSNRRLAETLTKLPHYTLSRFSKINVVVYGLSVRAARQITRHQTDVVFMSASLQYEKVNFGDDMFVVPNEYFGGVRDRYLDSCQESFDNYNAMLSSGNVSKDSAAYMLPLALRQVLLISATPYELAHIISARSCKRNTAEVVHIARLILSAVVNEAAIFRSDFALPYCLQSGGCKEGKMCCHKPYDPIETDYDFYSYKNMCEHAENLAAGTFCFCGEFDGDESNAEQEHPLGDMKIEKVEE